MPENLPVDFRGRFTGRVEAYRRYRSRFPREIIPLLREKCGLAPEHVIADIGAGTGMFAELFLENGNPVFAIEPNAEMRAACAELRSGYPQLACIDATAEATSLSDHSVDFVTAGRSFHWFNHQKCRPEFLRILRPNGWVVIASIGPVRSSEAVIRDHSAFLQKFDVSSSRAHSHEEIGNLTRAFFSGTEMHEAEFKGVDRLDFEGFVGHNLSISLTPPPGHPRFTEFQEAMRDFFDRHQSGGILSLPTSCEVYFGQPQFAKRL
jgi:ubiquinone/menaquinone biosynthesis C-methylase UbiE